MRSSMTTRVLAFAGLGLTATLAGCAPAATGGDPGTGGGDTSAEYTDGTYTADGSYVAPSGSESITVEITLADDVVTDVVVTPHATDSEAKVKIGRASCRERVLYTV